MARQPQKRLHLDDWPQSDTEPPTKKTKTQSEAEREAWASWTHPPAFWDRLSEIHLTRKALEEHNRRIRLQRRPSPLSPSSPGRGRAEHLVNTLPARGLARFARLGGPDLSDLRGVRRLLTSGTFTCACADHALVSTADSKAAPHFHRHECEPIFAEPDKVHRSSLYPPYLGNNENDSDQEVKSVQPRL